MPSSQKPEGAPAGSSKRPASRFYQLKTDRCTTGQYLNWTKNRLTAQCWWCRYRTQTLDHPFKVRPSGWSSGRSCRWRCGRKVGGGKSRFKIQDLLAGRFSQVILDSPSTTDVGRLVPAEEDMESEMSEWEFRDRRERGRRSGEWGPRSWAPRGGTTAIPPHALLHGIRRGVGDRYAFLLFSLVGHNFLCPFICDFLGAHQFFLGTGLGGRQRGACSVPPSRGQDSGRENWSKSVP